MGGLQIIIELLLIGLLGATLFQALRLQRTMGAVKQDRAELEAVIQSFNDSNQQAEAGADRLRVAADAASRAMTRQIEGASNLKDELADLIERGERLANRLGSAVRAEIEPGTQLRRASQPQPQPQPQPEPEMADASGARVRSQAERDLLRALRVNR